jgi:2-phosphosulfolactate phosphatase
MEDKVVVVVDVLRATTCMITALAHGVERILPVETLEEAANYQSHGYITCAERNGQKAEGFDLGNSPFGFMDPGLRHQTIVMTTTNGTKSIVRSKHAESVVVGSFANLGALSRFLTVKGRDVIVVCAGWKGKVNAEDTLFAGALATKLHSHFTHANDSVLLARSAYEHNRANLKYFLAKSSHFKRLMGFGLEKDIDFCLREDTAFTVPILNEEGYLVSR